MFPEASVPNIPYYENTQQYADPNYLLKTVQYCGDNCEQMITMLIDQEDSYSRKDQIQFLRDCADVCGLMATYFARSSRFSKGLAHFCAHVCGVCGRTCAQFSDYPSQQCAQLCLSCSEDCLSFTK